MVVVNFEVFEGVWGVGLMFGLKCKVSCMDVVNVGYESLVVIVLVVDNVVCLLLFLNIFDDEIIEVVMCIDVVV